MFITSLTQKIEWLANQSKLFYLLVGLYYKNIIKREATLARISKNDRILCIGGGPCPYTAIMLHRLTGAHVTVVDNNSFCVKESSDLIRRMDLQNAVQVLCSEGEKIDCNGFSVIHLAMQISPKEKVLKGLLEKAENGTKILVRMPRAVLNGFYCGVNCKPFSRGCVAHTPFANIDNTTLYVKEALPCEISA